MIRLSSLFAFSAGFPVTALDCVCKTKGLFFFFVFPFVFEVVVGGVVKYDVCVHGCVCVCVCVRVI